MVNINVEIRGPWALTLYIRFGRFLTGYPLKDTSSNPDWSGYSFATGYLKRHSKKPGELECTMPCRHVENDSAAARENSETRM